MRAGSQRGFSKFELVVSILAMVLLATLLYSRYIALVADAERAAFRGVMGWLQAGVNVRRSLALSRGDLAGLQTLEGGNPMALVAEVMNPPSNYLGELRGEAATEAPAGHWYFDAERGVLVYRFRYLTSVEGFVRAGDEKVEIRLKINHRPAANLTGNEVSGLELETVGPAR